MVHHRDTESTERKSDCGLPIADCGLRIGCRIPNTAAEIASLCSLCLCGYFFVAGIASAGAAQEVVPVDGKAFAAELVSVDADGRVTFGVAEAEGDAAEKTRTISLAQLVRWGHPVEPRPQTIVVLAGGGRLVTAADWSGGAAVRLDEDAVTVRSDTFEEQQFPRGAVRGVVFAQRRHADERAALARRVRGEPSPGPSLQGRGNGAPSPGPSLQGRGNGAPSPAPSLQGRENGDAVFLTNGDRLVGRIEELAGGSLSVAVQAGTAKLPLSRVEAVALGGSPLSVVRRQSQLIVALRDGSLLYADGVRAEENVLQVDLSEGVTLEGGHVEDVVALQSLGGAFVYLSDLEPAAYRHVPYLDMEWPYERDRSVDGGPLAVGPERYLKGIGMHTASRLTYGLEGKYRRFDAAVAVDDSAGRRGSVTFGVYVLRDGEWQEAYTSGIVRGGDAPQSVSVDVSGAQGLTLTVDYADRGDELDRANWLDARLVK